MTLLSLIYWFLLSRLKKRISYHSYLRSRAWQFRRSIIKWWASERCQLGYDHPGPFEAHHRTYKRIGREKLTDLVYLCKRCHGSVHSKKVHFSKNS